jgi:hypothetical protein
MKLDYTTLKEAVAEWKKADIDFMRETAGDAAAEDAIRLFEADEWYALELYVRDVRDHVTGRIENLPAPGSERPEITTKSEEPALTA